MDIMMRIAAAAVTAAVLAAVLRRQTPEIAVLLVLGTGAWILAITANALSGVVQLLQELAGFAGMREELLAPVVKTVALSLLTHLTAEICRGAGERGLAAFAETAGTVLAIGISLPLIRAVMILMGELLG